MSENCNLCDKKIKISYDFVYDGDWMTNICMSCRVKIGLAILNNQLKFKNRKFLVKCPVCGEVVNVKHVNISNNFDLKCSNCLGVSIPINVGLIRKLQKVEFFQYLENVLVVDGSDFVSINDLEDALCDYLGVLDLPVSHKLLGKYISELFNIRGSRLVRDGERFTVFKGLSLVYQESLNGLPHFSRFWLHAILGESVKIIEKVVPKVEVVESVKEDEASVDDGVSKEELLEYIKEAELKIVEYKGLLNDDYAHDQPILNLIEDEEADIEEMEETLLEFFDYKR
jgi:hypothetical protein